MASDTLAPTPTKNSTVSLRPPRNFVHALRLSQLAFCADVQARQSEVVSLLKVAEWQGQLDSRGPWPSTQSLLASETARSSLRHLLQRRRLSARSQKVLVLRGTSGIYLDPAGTWSSTKSSLPSYGRQQPSALYSSVATQTSFLGTYLCMAL